MAQENAEIVHQAFEAWNRGDIEAYLAHLCPDVEAVPAGGIAAAEVNSKPSRRKSHRSGGAAKGAALSPAAPRALPR